MYKQTLLRRWKVHARSAGKSLALVLLTVLAFAAVLRTLVALVEAIVLLILVLVAASLLLPHNLGWYWRQARREVPRWLQQVVDTLAGSESTGEQNEAKLPEKNNIN